MPAFKRMHPSRDRRSSRKCSGSNDSAVGEKRQLKVFREETTMSVYSSFRLCSNFKFRELQKCFREVSFRGGVGFHQKFFLGTSSGSNDMFPLYDSRNICPFTGTMGALLTAA